MFLEEFLSDGAGQGPGAVRAEWGGAPSARASAEPGQPLVPWRGDGIRTHTQCSCAGRVSQVDASHIFNTR